MANSAITKRMKEYVSLKNVSIRSIETAVGVSNGTLGKAFSNDSSVTTETLEKFLQKYSDINSDWLIYGNQPMLKSESSYMVTGEGVPLITAEAMAGYSGGDVQVMDYELEYYHIPEWDRLKIDFLIRVKGKSMMNRYYPGDLVACQYKKNDEIEGGCIYVLDTTNGPQIKRVKKGKNDTLILISENPEFDPFEIHLSEVRSVARVYGGLTFD